VKLDKIGIWSEIKLEIIKKYASAYTSIMSKQNWCKGYVYIDAFAGAGKHISRKTGELVLGSPLNALEIRPPFREYHFIDLDEDRADVFKQIAVENPDVHSYHGNCNEILIKDIFPKLTYDSFKRALCIFDPYGEVTDINDNNYILYSEELKA
jgi:three-Cys-motif partner protein